MAISAQIPLNLEPSRPDSFDTFVDGPNAAVTAALKALAESVARTVYLQGPPGSGKTHLLNATCRDARERGKVAIYLPLARLRPQSGVAAAASLERLGNVDLVCVDDVDAIAGERTWEEAMFHAFNQVRECGGNMLVSGCAPLGDLPLDLPDLQSRLGWDLQFALKGLADEDKLRALKARASVSGHEVEDEVLSYLIRRGQRDMGTLAGLLDSTVQAALSTKRRITVPLAREVLRAGGPGGPVFDPEIERHAE